MNIEDQLSNYADRFDLVGFYSTRVRYFAIWYGAIWRTELFGGRLTVGDVHQFRPDYYFLN